MSCALLVQCGVGGLCQIKERICLHFLLFLWSDAVVENLLGSTLLYLVNNGPVHRQVLVSSLKGGKMQ